MAEPECPYVSRGGLKLEHALREFGIDPSSMWCADLGASTGGFTDCLLQHGAERVYAVDTAYGEFAWKLRNDPRVVVMERSNALHTEPPPEVTQRAAGGVDLVVIDLGWTRQSFAIPVALRWLSRAGRIISLVKPHYEAPEDPSPDASDAQDQPKHGFRRSGGRSVRRVVLEEAEAERITRRVVDELPAIGVRVIGLTRSPVLGGALSGKKKQQGAGNAEWLVCLERDGNL
jgi:23S rRNA (cytidine1920-2'-O)/16S rRNA (cytidine1409-2'-O)-methyltransferase